VNLDVFFLGTAASVPTTTRITTATLIRRGGERILVDCGEGVQRRLMQSAAGLVDVDVILLTHAHADHYLGLPGLLKTFGLREREAPLTVYGPPGTGALVAALRPLIGRVSFPFVSVDVEPGEDITCDGYRLEAVPTVHRVPSVGWALVEDPRPGRFDVDEARRRGVPEGPAFGVLQRGGDVTLADARVVHAAEVVGEPRAGRRVVISGDTRPCDGVLAASLKASLLVHEATFMHEEQARARETRHATAREAAQLAAEAGVAMLFLTHVSTRYAPRAVRDEARREFAATYVPRDLDAAEIPFPERGGPRIVQRDCSSHPDHAEEGSDERDGADLRRC
jgi:ribonuclease Z